MRTTVVLLAYLAGILTVTTGTALARSDLLFPDVIPNSYFFDAVTRFARTSIITGYKDGRFGPHDYVTRAQVAVILDRYDQQVIGNLRQQVDAMREQLSLGRCGDHVVQIGEDCDDGNALNGDGCSAHCLQEIHCTGGFKIGDRYPAPDGCNVCTCTEAGIACTERACTQKKCFSSAECGSTEVCSVEVGDCRFPCPPNAVCVQSCAGVCLPKAVLAVCGNGVCEAGESAYPDRTGQSLYCPQDCTIESAVCGNGICERGEADEYGLGQNGSDLLRRGTCPDDCTGGLSDCEQEKKALDILFTSNVSCQSNDDCTIFVQACSPYQTCGKPINKSARVRATTAVLNYADHCEQEGTPICAACLPQEVQCQNGACVLNELN